ncbi:hypothetical protein AC579_5592 [Pseudocercospora musae]|uniref:Uncharacterized protein n=1 Tax=Pseudocercospora musae TaxID=113226 RepID=A0A139IP66_9PEZI|nr:hypothetical protein AC579_5592 [Pseudocercospora musae]
MAAALAPYGYRRRSVLLRRFENGISARLPAFPPSRLPAASTLSIARPKRRSSTSDLRITSARRKLGPLGKAEFATWEPRPAMLRYDDIATASFCILHLPPGERTRHTTSDDDAEASSERNKRPPTGRIPQCIGALPLSLA